MIDLIFPDWPAPPLSKQSSQHTGWCKRGARMTVSILAAM